MKLFFLSASLFYFISLLGIFAVFLKRLGRRYYIPIVAITVFMVLGEVSVLLSNPGLGTSFYAVAQLVLFYYLSNAFGGRIVKYGGILMSIACVVFFTGNFWQADWKGMNNINITHTSIAVLYISNALIFIFNKIKNSSYYIGIFTSLSLWLLGILILVNAGFAEFAIVLYSSIWKCIIGLLLLVTAYRLYNGYKD